MGSRGRASGREVRGFLKLKAFEHLASKGDGKFAKKNFCILQIAFVSHRWFRKIGLLNG